MQVLPSPSTSESQLLNGSEHSPCVGRAITCQIPSHHSGPEHPPPLHQGHPSQLRPQVFGGVVPFLTQDQPHPSILQPLYFVSITFAALSPYDGAVV